VSRKSHNADRTNPKWLMRNYVRLACLLVVSVIACHSQDKGRLNTFFKQNIRLNDSEIAGIEHGKPVAKVLDSHTPSQVFVFGAVFIKAQPVAYVRLAGDLDSLKSLPNYLAIQRLSDPPQLSDLRGPGRLPEMTHLCSSSMTLSWIVTWNEISNWNAGVLRNSSKQLVVSWNVMVGGRVRMR
jgi:hypothetical protein